MKSDEKPPEIINERIYENFGICHKEDIFSLPELHIRESYLTFSHSSLSQVHTKLTSFIISNNLRLSLKKYLLSLIPIKLKFYHNYVISAPHGPLAKECHPISNFGLI